MTGKTLAKYIRKARGLWPTCRAQMFRRETNGTVCACGVAAAYCVAHATTPAVACDTAYSLIEKWVGDEDLALAAELAFDSAHRACDPEPFERAAAAAEIFRGWAPAKEAEV